MGKIKAGIIVFLGSNCERDTKRACEFFGWDAQYIDFNQKIGGNFDIIFLPGGFSYGDHISSGRIAKLTPAVQTLPIGKSLVVGICNGFQILCESGLLSGALTYNQNLKFISKLCPLKFHDEKIYLPIAHKQGNYILSDMRPQYEKTILEYENDENGSDAYIAGVYDFEKRVIGMMPHPERAIFDKTKYTDGRKVFKFFENEI